SVPLPQDEVKAFADAVMLRFENPFNRHELLSIALNSVSKWTARVLPTLKDYQKKTGEIPACLAFGLTSLICFYTGIKQNEAGEYEGLRDGKPYPVKDDAHVLTFFAAQTEPDAHAVLSNAALWGEDLTAIPGLEAKVAAQLADIKAGCIRCAMRKAFAK
ncbi:MAG: tagaturonate reductase, partial [Clostridia bacterium]|nr:tagaturonate reductase [Clostridia bacterium]